MPIVHSTLTGETLRGETVSFSHEAYADAMARYKLYDIEEVAHKIELGEHISSEVADFFRDLAIVEEADHPDYDRGVAIGTLATRIELASGQVSSQDLIDRGLDIKSDLVEYQLAFGFKYPVPKAIRPNR